MQHNFAIFFLSFFFFGCAKNLGICEAAKDCSRASSKRREKKEHLWAAFGGANELGQPSLGVIGLQMRPSKDAASELGHSLCVEDGTEVVMCLCPRCWLRTRQQHGSCPRCLKSFMLTVMSAAGGKCSARVRSLLLHRRDVTCVCVLGYANCGSLYSSLRLRPRMKHDPVTCALICAAPVTYFFCHSVVLV